MTIWTPSSDSLLLTGSVQGIVEASNQIDGVALFVNTHTTAGFIALATANATAGEMNHVPIVGGSQLFVAFGSPLFYARVTGATAVYAQAGYMVK